jgi:hypothetical protein
MTKIVKGAQNDSLSDMKSMVNSQIQIQQVTSVGPPDRLSPLAIVNRLPCLALPPYFQSNGTSINQSIEYEFIPKLDIDFSFLTTNGSARCPLLKGKYEIFDFEWEPGSQVMLCATFSDNLGNKVQKHIEDFPVGGEEDL